jgi:hypothetical protein
MLRGVVASPYHGGAGVEALACYHCCQSRNLNVLKPRKKSRNGTFCSETLIVGTGPPTKGGVTWGRRETEGREAAEFARFCLPISMSALPPKADRTSPGRRANTTRDCASITRFQFAHNVNGGIATGGGCYIDLRVTIVRIAPASAFEQSVSGRNPA